MAGSCSSGEPRGTNRTFCRLLDNYPCQPASDETFSISDAAPGGKTWSSNTDWWFVDGALTYETLGLGKLLAGFRYDRFAANFKDPGNFSGPVGSPSDTGDVTINCYIPFVGVQVEQGTPGGSQLMFRVIGFPWLGGDVLYHDSIGNFSVLTQDRIELQKGIGKGYFLEAFAGIWPSCLWERSSQCVWQMEHVARKCKTN